ncbi:MAG: hypothetical protein CXX71_02175 [Methanobacteriota archaeon]|jgi:SepF-like predicted cell division protein (DUF552 family)|nr:MAG: hypothetical protein CXX71_02175 [Euryarchaeota archaeon]
MSEEQDGDEPRWLKVPSIEPGPLPSPDPGQVYHDLGSLYPDAPVPRHPQEVVIRRAVLHDVSGLEMLLDWAADGQIVIIELRRIIDRDFELTTAIEQLSNFVEGDLGGQLVQLGEERILLLPPGFRGMSGLEAESFEGT